MFKQIGTNLKFIGAILFTILFFVGGFFMNTIKAEAATTVQSFGVSYSLSDVMSTTNSDGSLTTRILVGCAPQSGDLYDINTGRLCSNNVQTALVGCRVGSGDVFDINTGIRCSSYIKSVLVGCGINSGDLYDINTGKRCTNISTNIIITAVAKTNNINIISKITPISISKTNVVSRAVEISPIASNLKEILPTKGNGGGLSEPSGREKIKDTLNASVVKVSSILNGPMSVWIILLIILILLGGSYGIYSLLKNDDPIETKTEKIHYAPIIPNIKTPIPDASPLSINNDTINQGSLLNNEQIDKKS